MSDLKNYLQPESDSQMMELKNALDSIDRKEGLAQEKIISLKICAVINYLKTKVKRSPQEPPPDTSRRALLLKLIFWAAVILVTVFMLLSLVWYLTGQVQRQDWAELFLLSGAGLLVVGAPIYLLGSLLYKMITSEYLEQEGFIHRVLHNTHYALDLRQACGEPLLNQVATYLKWQIDTQLDMNAHIGEFFRGASVLFLGMIVAFGISPDAKEYKVDTAVLAALGIGFALFVRSIVTARVVKFRIWLSMIDQAVNVNIITSDKTDEARPEPKPSFFKKMIAFVRLN